MNTAEQGSAGNQECAVLMENAEKRFGSVRRWPASASVFPADRCVDLLVRTDREKQRL